jgi:hypothetical protein
MPKLKDVSFNALLVEVRNKGTTDKQDGRHHIITHLPLQAELELDLMNALNPYTGQIVRITIGPAQGDLDL